MEPYSYILSFEAEYEVDPNDFTDCETYEEVLDQLKDDVRDTFEQVDGLTLDENGLFELATDICHDLDIGD